MLPLFYQRSQPRVGQVGIILVQSNDNPNVSSLAAESKSTQAPDPWWPNGKSEEAIYAEGGFVNVGLNNWHRQRAAWRVPKGTRRPPPPPVEYEAVIEGLSIRQRTFQLPGWIGLTDLIDMYIDLWEMDY